MACITDYVLKFESRSLETHNMTVFKQLYHQAATSTGLGVPMD